MQIGGGQHNSAPYIVRLGAYREFEQCAIAVEMNDTAQHDCGIHVAHMRWNQRGFRVQKPSATSDFAVAAETSFGPPFPKRSDFQYDNRTEIVLVLVGS